MTTASSSPALAHRIIGIGNAGVNFLDRLLVSAPTFSGLVAINNDEEALAASVVATQILIPSDLEISAPAADADFIKLAPRLAEEIQNASVIILAGGLGGRCASTFLPQVASACKAANKLVVACVTLPFSFEGKRAQALAAESLSSLEKNCDGVIVLDNNRLCSTSASITALGETFAAADEAVHACIPALLTILFNKGPVRIARASFLKALHRRGAKTHFGYGQATGANRLHEAVERALKSPLLERGRSLSKASDIFLLVRGPKDISFAEVQAAMQGVERFAPKDHDIELSVHADGLEGTPLQIFLLAIVGGDPILVPKKEPLAKTREINSDVLKKETVAQTPRSALEEPRKTIPAPLIISETAHHDVKKIPEEKKSDEEIKELFPTTLYESADDSKNVVAAKMPVPSKIKQTQGDLNLKAVQRGRFDKSEPTIVEGEDLDTPTYLRLGLKLS